MHIRSFRSPLPWVLLVVALLAAGCANERITEPDPAPSTAEGIQAGTLEPGIYLGPVEGFTRGWHRLDPDATAAVPRGATVLLRSRVDASASVQWKGAREVSRDGSTVTAEVSLADGNVHEVTLLAVGTTDFPALYRCRLKAFEQAGEPQLENVSLAAAPLFAGSSIGLDPNMMVFFAGSNAVLQGPSDGVYVTSVDRALELETRASSPVYGSLIEWSSDGIPVALGPTARLTLSTPGRHVIEARLGASSMPFVIDAYAVSVVRVDGGGPLIQDGVPATFRAVTDPPGHEDEVTWRADTVAGTAVPLRREGGLFTVVFEGTWSARDNGKNFQWLGVRADNAVVVQDQMVDVNLFQLDFDLDGTVALDSDWGHADVTFAGSADLLYLNLSINGSWQLENVPVRSINGAGVFQTVTYALSLGVSAGVDVASVLFGMSLTPGIVSQMPPSTTQAGVSDRQIRFGSGGAGASVGPLTPAAGQAGGAAANPTKYAHKDFPNQECGDKECTPAAVSNSLQFLNQKHNLNMAAADITIGKMKDATKWGVKPEGTGSYIEHDDGRPAGTRNAWWEDKAAYMAANMLPITTTRTNTWADVEQAICNGKDVELQGGWHTAAIVGITDLGGGKYSIDVAHDTDQGNPGGTKVETITYDPATARLKGSPGFFDGSPFTYAVIECPSPPGVGME